VDKASQGLGLTHTPTSYPTKDRRHPYGVNHRGWGEKKALAVATRSTGHPHGGTIAGTGEEKH